MTRRTPLTTIAAALALALALLVAVMLPTDNLVYAANPSFDSGGGTRSIPENTPPGVNIGAPISATDADEGKIEYADTLTYSLNGTDAASFDIDSSTGQLITKAALDAETKDSYSVTVTVKDSIGTAVTQDVTITVTGVDEAPGALAAPTVVSADVDNNADNNYELKVIWYAPDDPGDGVTGYDVEYKKTTAASFTDFDHSGTTATANITGLDVDTAYHVRVRATGDTTGAENGPWSLSSVGTTNKKDNDLPTFGGGDVNRNVLENAEAGLVVGAPVSATDDDNVLPLAYRLHGPDAGSFDLQASTGQIRTKRGVVYDYEKKRTLNVTMTVSDGQGGTDATAVTISVTDVPEAPSKPDRPTVRATAGSSRSLDVSWKAPDNTGPAITGYDVRYSKGSSDKFTLITPSPTGTGTTYTIAPTDDDLSDGDDRLAPGASYKVSVRAKNGESPSQWSDAGTGRTSAGNSEPTFDDRDDVTRGGDGSLPAASTKRAVAENTRSGQSVGRAVGAVDGNGDKRTYRLVAAPDPNTAHVNKFDINESTGQILTKDPLDHEAQCSTADAAKDGGHAGNCTYTVVVQVWDGLNEHRNKQDTSSLNDNDDTNDSAVIDDTITVEITVSDVIEKPAAPAVTVTSPESGTDLVLTWTAPDNTGPAITGYELECTGTPKPPTAQCPKDDIDATTVTHTIASLTAGKSYRVRLRAVNAEGDGVWSSWVTQSTNKTGNALPAFDGNAPTTVYVEENAPSTRQPVTTDSTNPDTVASLLGTDTTDGDTLTLRLEGPGAGRFDIDNGTGQIKTRSKLNYEDPECNPAGTSCTYSVRVKLSDPNGGSVFHTLAINVTDKDEPPAAPSAPRVTATSGSGWSLEVTWTEPRNDGSAITSYQIRYRKTGDNPPAAWQRWLHTGTGRSAKITTIRTDPDSADTAGHLSPSTQYEVQVRALNGEGDSTFDDASNWSSSGRGTTGKGNRRPVFESTASVVELEVEENTRSGQNVGSAVEATDADKNSLTYTLEGPGKDSFSITSGGQIRTRASLNYEERDKYSLTVKVDDRQRKDNSVAAKSVTIKVTDRPEAPSAPSAPKVTGIPGSTDSVRVTWDEPANTGPPITHYNVQYGTSGALERVAIPHGSADRSAIITGLTAGTRYEVQVRARNAEGQSDWSRSGTGSPNPDQENRRPSFSGGSRTFSVAENTSPGANVGDLVAALDQDGDTLIYTLEGVDADSFDIIVSNSAGQIQTKADLNYEDKASYSVSVRARDGRGGTDAVNVTIRVTDVDGEAPDTPFAPTVTALSSTSIQVNWEAPENDGPPITDYDYRYRAVGDTDWTEVTNTTIAGTTATIDSLTASTSYDVEVRAKNAEGTSEWSNPGNGATNAPGANNAPVFTDGTSATRSISASAQPNTPIGDPIRATDADSDDTLTYTLEGAHAGLFAIDAQTGQLRTSAALTVDETYRVTVAVSDTKDTVRIDVTINATAAPPNNPPVFSGTSRSFTVRENASAGTAIGSPVTATDADSGDTLTYTLEGTDAASFDIRTTSAGGQIVTKSGVTLDADTKSTYTVTVVATDNKQGRATIAVTITVVANNPPVFSEGAATTRSVRDNESAGTSIGNPVTATDADGDTLTYTLGGTSAASFGIGSTTGQIVTKAGVTLRAGDTHSVTVVATDGTDSATIAVTITVIRGIFGCATSAAVSDASNTGLVADCEALLAARNTLEGSARLNWSVSTPIQQWEGVYLRGTPERVTWIILRRRGLDGSIPAQLGQLSSLTILNFHSNALTEQIPNEIGNLTNLEQLLLHNNSLSGDFPNLSRLSRLKKLWFSGKNNRIGQDKGIPLWLNNLTSLEEINLWGNEMGGSIPTLSGLSNLKLLKLQNNSLTGNIPSWFGDMNSLGGLYLHANNLSGSIPSELGQLTRLRRLWLDRNQLSGSIPPALGNMSNLGTLNLHTNRLTGSIPPQLGNLSKLQHFALQNNQLTGIIPAQLSYLSEMTRLAVSGNQLSGPIPAELGALPKLSLLWIHNNRLTGQIPSQLGDLSDTLTNIKLAGNSFAADACIPPALANVARNDYTEAGLTACSQ